MLLMPCLTWQDGSGGKLHVFISSLPKLGLHGLTPRQGSAPNNSQQKQSVLQPAHKGFQTMAEDAAEHQVRTSASHPATQPAWILLPQIA